MKEETISCMWQGKEMLRKRHLLLQHNINMFITIITKNARKHQNKNPIPTSKQHCTIEGKNSGKLALISKELMDEAQRLSNAWLH